MTRVELMIRPFLSPLLSSPRQLLHVSLSLSLSLSYHPHHPLLSVSYLGIFTVMASLFSEAGTVLETLQLGPGLKKEVVRLGEASGTKPEHGNEVQADK